MAYFRKYARRAAKKVGRAVKRRYFRGKGYANPKLATMVRDLQMVKRSLNVEKKNITTNLTLNTPIGQINGNNTLTGAVYFDLTPPITQGVGFNQMTGNSVKLVSMAIFGQVKQQTSTRHPMRVKITLFKTNGIPQNVSTIGNNAQLYEQNPITTCVDYNSQRNVNFFRDYSVIQTKYLYLQPDPVSGEIILKDFKFLMKMSHHLKWNNNTTNLSAGQLAMCVTCDSGNSSASTASTASNIPIVHVSSGASIQFYTRFYYVDN